MAYIGKSMSENAFQAHQQGLFVKSEVTAKFLKNYDFKYSVGFFKWLIDKKYIKPVGYHHTSVGRNMTRFFSPKVIDFMNNNFNLDTLYKLYLGKTNKEEIKEMLGIKYVRAVKSIILFNQHVEYICDCVACNERFYWDKSSIIINETGKVRIIEEFSEKPNNWNNSNTKSIVNTLIVYKNPDIKTRIRW